MGMGMILMDQGLFWHMHFTQEQVEAVMHILMKKKNGPCLQKRPVVIGIKLAFGLHIGHDSV